MSNHAKHFYICYWYDSQLSKISSEIYIFHFGYLSSGHYIYVSKDVRADPSGCAV
jgi:hypothetical protein